MSELRDWAADQLRRAGYDTKIGKRASISNSVDLLLKEFETQKHDPETRLRVAELFYKLASGHAIAPREVQDSGGKWVQLRLGDVSIGATVRIKRDAYDGDAGVKHNGMVGRLVGARGGMVSVQYSESTEGTGHNHDPRLVEVLVKR